MKGYFYSKPLNLDEVRDAIGMFRREGCKPKPINPVAMLELDAGTYSRFARGMLEDWDFLKPYKHTVFRMYGTADCVLIRAEDKPTLAVCMEGYGYARYVALVLEEEISPSDLRKG